MQYTGNTCFYSDTQERVKYSILAEFHGVKMFYVLENTLTIKLQSNLTTYTIFPV